MSFSRYFGFELNKQQSDVFGGLVKFTESTSERAFILKGYAGTGKSTLMSGLIKYLKENGIAFNLLASTGRAAKILSDKTNVRATTIHSQIYAYKGLSEDVYAMRDLKNKLDVDDKGQISLQFEIKAANSSEQTIYVIDEASMVSDRKSASSSFADYGSGRLLLDMLTHDSKGKFIFIGDPNQLPPINEKRSPALNGEYLKDVHDLSCMEYELTHIIRQKQESGIVNMSLNIRKQYINNFDIKWPKLKARGYNDVEILDSTELIVDYIDAVEKTSYEHCTLIAPSNRLCTSINKIVRKSLFNHPEILVKNDLLLVTQNNLPTGLANGDLVTVNEIGTTEKRSGLTFRTIEVKELVSGEVKKAFLVEDILSSNYVNIDTRQHKELMIDFAIRMHDIGIKQNTKEFDDMMRNDPYLNALKAVYGYALTCHKSQGGEWDKVYLYLDKSMYFMGKPTIYQWWYTAVTRAKNELKLGIVDNWIIN